MGINRLIQAALQGKPVAWFAPNYRLLSDVWRELQSLLGPIIANVNQQERRIELLGGGVIEAWSLDSPDAGRGRAYRVVVIDEAAMIPNLEQAWNEGIRPMLTDYQGEAWFLSTPRGMGFFKLLFDRGQDPERKDWASWQMPTSENPFIATSEVNAARLDLTESAFSQEYLAQFVNWEGSVFRRLLDAATAPRGAKRELDHQYVIGCDWGRSNDYTVFLVLDVTARMVVELDRSNRVDYSLQCARLEALSQRWRPVQIIAEQNSIGQPIIEQLNRQGLRVQPFITTHASKADAVEALALAFERGDIRIPNDPVLIGELMAYQADRLPSGLIRYGAPAGQHDDTVMALAIAWTAVSGQHHAVYPLPDSEIVVADFEIPPEWKQGYVVEVSGRWTSAIWGALDPETDRLYLVGEYSAEADVPVHIAELQRRGAWIPGLFDPSANGREQIDGFRLMEIFENNGLHLEAALNPLEAGIMEVQTRMGSGRLKVFASLTNFLDERRRYRRDESGRVIDAGHRLQNAARCLVTNVAMMRSRQTQTALIGYERGGFEHRPNFWMAS